MNNHKEQDPNSWKPLGFFNGDGHLTFTFKKAEKITAALYLVSSLLKDNEPIKWDIREKGLEFLSSAIALNGAEPIDKNEVLQNLFSTSFETISVLNIASISGLVSEMNYSILKRELEAVVALLKQRVVEDASKAGYILSDSFFKTDDSLLLRTESYKTIEKNQGALVQKANNTSREMQKDKVAIKDKKDDRKTAIIELLNKQSNLTIKDFTKVIHNCSEKTIQRELLDLVSKGVVKKVGERRWSTYSLAK
jgi:predicted transcriptional regulator